MESHYSKKYDKEVKVTPSGGSNNSGSKPGKSAAELETEAMLKIIGLGYDTLDNLEGAIATSGSREELPRFFPKITAAA